MKRKKMTVHEDWMIRHGMDILFGVFYCGFFGLVALIMILGCIWLVLRACALLYGVE